MEVCCLLPVELTTDCATVLSGTKSLEAVIDQLGVLFMEVFMGHNIGGAGVHLAAAHLQAKGKARLSKNKVQAQSRHESFSLQEWFEKSLLLKQCA